VSIRINRPIIELVLITGDIRDGNFPEKNAAPKSNDEIGGGSIVLLTIWEIP
jgi:hypothetical protein